MIERLKIKSDFKKEIKFHDDEVNDSKMRIERLKKRMSDKGRFNLYGYKGKGKRLYIHSVFLDEDKINCYTGLKFFLDCGLGNFQQVLTNASDVTINVLGEEYTIPSKTDLHGVNHQTWNEVLDMAILLRDTEIQEKLLALPIWEPDGIIDVFDFTLARYRKALLEGDEREREVILKYAEKIKDSDESIMNTIDGPIITKSPLRSAYFSNFLLPIIRLNEYALTGKEEEFNQELEKSILARKERIKSRKDEDDSRDWINFQLLACCAYAYDKGIKITVESEYIPRYVYEGDYPKEILDFSETEI